ncbi:MAG: hypothetical protein R3D84_07925 [Paracoccaceae bacterium]
MLDLIADLVANGLRARLNTASLLASNLVIDLDEIDDAAPAELNRTADPYPILPSVPANISDFTATAEGVFERINALPIEETLQSAIDLMKSLDGLANDPSLRAAPERALALIDDARAFVGSEDMAELPKTCAPRPRMCAR